MSSADFNRITEKIHATTGIVLQAHKAMMVRGRLKKRVADLGFASFCDYLNFLDDAADDAELVNFCNALTTNLTSFFREHHHFEHLENELKVFANSGKKRLRIWSAGCSTGEEAYSIALVCRKVLGALSDFDIKILATDVDTEVLKVAKRGAYPGSELTDVVKKMNIQGDVFKVDGTFDLKSTFGDIISFKYLNLIDDWPFSWAFDMIFCRNVLIYFDARTKAGIIEGFSNSLRPSGVLYLGHSETILGTHPELVLAGKTTYRRRV